VCVQKSQGRQAGSTKYVACRTYDAGMAWWTTTGKHTDAQYETGEKTQETTQLTDDDMA